MFYFLFYECFNSKEFWDILVSIATILAILIGGFWTFLIFIKQRFHKPLLEINHKIELFPFNEEYTLLKLYICLENKGVTFIKGINGHIVITNLSPKAEDDLLKQKFIKGEDIIDNKTFEIEWDDLIRRTFKKKEHYLEPKEKDDHIFDFIISNKINYIRIYTHIENNTFRDWKKLWFKKKEYGWNKTSTLRLDKLN